MKARFWILDLGFWIENAGATSMKSAIRNHYCPVKFWCSVTFLSLLPNRIAQMLGYTISFSITFVPPATGRFARRCGHELRSHRLCSTARTASPPRFRVGHRTIRRREEAPALLLHGSTALHDLRADHGPIESARDGQLPSGAGLALLSLRHSGHAGAEPGQSHVPDGRQFWILDCGFWIEKRGRPVGSIQNPK